MRTLGLGDLTIFKCFRVIFSLKEKTIQFPYSFDLYFSQKKIPKVVNFTLTYKTLCLSFWNHKQGKWRQSYLQVVMYLFNSLAKSCGLFSKYSETINRNNIFELAYDQ